MAREGLSVLFCAAALLAATPAGPAAPPADVDAKVRSQLAVQAALQQGQDCLKRGNYQAAVFILEEQIARISGNREYLLALRDAYRGYIAELQQANRLDEAQTYLTRLRIIDRGAQIDPPAAAAPVATSPVTTAPVVRPQKPELEDPFADGNKPAAPQARALVAQGEQEFRQEHFSAAGKLYEQAHQLDPNATLGCRNQWAYCKLYDVNEALKQPGGPPAADLEAEVKRALALTSAPKLESFGKELLPRIRARGGAAAPPTPAVEVRHTPAQGQGWAVAETTNFRVLHRGPREEAEKVARAAEATRAAMTLQWFGEQPGPWNPRCDVYLHATADDYARETQAPKASPGHSTTKTEGERVVMRRIDLRCDEPHLLDAVLPHETTHVVLRGRFGSFTVPRWADEGMAVLSEPRERVELHLRNLPRHRQEHTLFPMAQLLKMLDKYPDARSIGPFYAQSVSVVEFLSSQPGGPRVFSQFVRDGLEGGFEAALQRHYHIDGYADLEQRWQRHAFGSPSASARLSDGK
jgi:tetratricopeptide (TPR) repeat protein